MNKVLKNFLDEDGRIKAYPSKRKLQIACAFYVVEQIPSGVDFTEKEINEMIKRCITYGDHVTVRRDMIDLGMLFRTDDCRVYRKPETQPSPEAYGLPNKNTAE